MLVSTNSAQSLWGGTTIILLKTKNELVIAADSKATDSLDLTNNNHTSCKIVQVGKNFFATTGLTEYSTANNEIKFNIDQISTQALKSSSSLSEKAATLEKLVSDILPKVLKLLLDQYPIEMKRDWFEGRSKPARATSQGEGRFGTKHNQANHR